MPLNIVQIVNNYFTPGFNSHLSESLHEPEAGISKALLAIIPAALNGILNRATSGKEGAEHIFEISKNAADLMSPVAGEEHLHAINESQNLSGIFGSNQTEILSAISKFAGIQNVAVSSLTALVVPAIIGFLGKHAKENDLSASGLSGFLSSQHKNISNSFPREIPSLSQLSNVNSFSPLEKKVSSSPIPYVTKIVDNLVDEVEAPKPPKGGIVQWMLPLVLIALILFLVWYFSKN